MRKENSCFKTKFISEPGSYIKNRDYFAFIELEDCACYCIADGIDEDPKKESAFLAISVILEAFHESPGFSKRALKRYLLYAQEELHREATEARLESSIVVLLTNYKKVIWAHAGNSRLYFVRNESIKYRTIDHSLSQNLATQGEIPLDQIDVHEERHNLYTYLGQSGRLNPSITSKRKLEDGDILLLCTRGVWETVGTPELLDSMEGVHDPETVCTGLEEVILSQQEEVLDNYTIAAIFVDKVYRNPKANRNKKIMKIIGAVVAILSVVLITIGIARYRSNSSKYQAMETSLQKGITRVEEKDYNGANQELDTALELSETIRVRSNSKKGQTVHNVKEYSNLVKELVAAKEFLDNEFYENAAKAFQDAVFNIEKLKDPSIMQPQVKQILLAYRDYATEMEKANNLVEEKRFEEATSCFVSAQKSGIKAGDMECQTSAESKKNEAIAQSMVLTGDKFMEEAKKHFRMGEFTGALTDYQSALNSYDSASSLDKEIDVVQKQETAKLGVQNANTAITNQSVKEKEKEAKKHIKAGDKKYKGQKYEQAITSYETAKAIYNDLNNSTMVSIVDEYITKAQNKIDKEAQKEEEEKEEILEKDNKASKYLLEASELYSEKSYQKAMDLYSLAKDLYIEIDKREEAKTLERIISSIKKQKKEEEKLEKEKKRRKENNSIG